MPRVQQIWLALQTIAIMHLFLSILLRCLLISVSVSGKVIFKPENDFQPVSGQSYSFPIDLSPLFNNRGFGLAPNEADFDGYGSKDFFLL